MNNGKSALVVGNGYNSTNGHSVLYIFFLDADGSLSSVKKIDTGASGDNGLSAPTVFDTDGNGTVDAIYAGDLKGNVWKFDVSSSSDTAWAVAYSGNPLFVAKDSSNNVQPITAPMAVAKDTVADDPNYGKVFVFFGTGSYFQSVILPATQCKVGMGLSTRPRSLIDLPCGRGHYRDGIFQRRDVRTFSAATAGDMTASQAGTSTWQHPAW
jgi:type IV pilus assembly protein PilY1